MIILKDLNLKLDKNVVECGKMYNMITVGEAAKMLNVCIKTLQNWDNKGLLKAKRTPTNRRFYTREQLEEFLNERRDV